MPDYWDFISTKGKDNIWKRAAILSRLSTLGLMETSVLEIGVGLGTAAMTLQTIFLNRWGYIGTDVSQKNCDALSEYLEMHQADVVDLPFPDKQFDTIIALDTLEHVEHKIKGFYEIDRVLKRSGRIVLNIPTDESLHPEAQEFGFSLRDLSDLMDICKMRVDQYEPYTVTKSAVHLVPYITTQKEVQARYVWVVGVR